MSESASKSKLENESLDLKRIIRELGFENNEEIVNEVLKDAEIPKFLTEKLKQIDIKALGKRILLKVKRGGRIDILAEIKAEIEKLK